MQALYHTPPDVFRPFFLLPSEPTDTIKGMQHLLYILLSIAAGLLIWSSIEPMLLRMVFSQMRCGRTADGRAEVTGRVIRRTWARRQAELSRGSLRVALISDLHGIFMRVPMRKLIRALQAAKPDVVLFAGDVSTWAADRAAGLRHLARLNDACRDMDIPMYGVPGNHDLGLTAEDTEACGLHFLYNTSARITDAGGRPWAVLGLTDLKTGSPDLQAALDHLNAPDIPPERRITLAHNPDTIYRLSAGQTGSVLTGHFHGGQIRLPFRMEYKTLRSDRLCAEGVYGGHHGRNGVSGYISAGLGCVLIPFRFLSPPELSVLDYDWIGEYPDA